MIIENSTINSLSYYQNRMINLIKPITAILKSNKDPLSKLIMKSMKLFPVKT